VNITYIATIGAFLFLIILWAAVAVRHLKLLKKNLDTDWEFVDEKIRKRSDIIPFLIEISGKKDEALIAVRDQARRIYFSCGDKVEKEHDLSKSIGSFLAEAEKNLELSKNSYFLEGKNEIDDLNRDIENRSRQYNETVQKFNSEIKFFLLAPFALIMKYKQAMIFEFEK